MLGCSLSQVQRYSITSSSTGRHQVSIGILASATRLIILDSCGFSVRRVKVIETGRPAVGIRPGGLTSNSGRTALGTAGHQSHTPVDQRPTSNICEGNLQKARSALGILVAI